MSEEEKKAIEETRKALMKTSLGYDVDFDINILDILLNLIQKQQEEIKLLKDQKQYVIDEYERTIEEKDRQIKQLTQTNKSYKGMINKKDKIIDEMAVQVCLTEEQRKEFEKNIYKLDKPKDFKSFVKQYFEKKVEEDNETR